MERSTAAGCAMLSAWQTTGGYLLVRVYRSGNSPTDPHNQSIHCHMTSTRTHNEDRPRKTEMTTRTTPHSHGGIHLPGTLSRLAVGGVGLGAFNALLARAGRSVCRRLEPNAHICSRARLQRGRPAGTGSADETAEARDDRCCGRLGQRRRRW